MVLEREKHLVKETAGKSWKGHGRHQNWFWRSKRLAEKVKSIPDICHFFTQTRFFENKIYTEERINYDKQISRQNSVN